MSRMTKSKIRNSTCSSTRPVFFLLTPVIILSLVSRGCSSIDSTLSRSAIAVSDGRTTKIYNGIKKSFSQQMATRITSSTKSISSHLLVGIRRLENDNQGSGSAWNNTSSSANATNEEVEQTQQETTPPKWEGIYVGCLILIMFAALIWGRFSADWVLMVVLALCMAPGSIISVPEGLAGFSSEGLWTVMILFVVAAGLSNTGALDWYMCIMLGKPQRGLPDAQLRIFVPLTLMSAFINNTPIVVIMIPVIQRWSRNIRIPVGQLMLPMCYAVILGGQCTFIGSSTNLVALGLLQRENPNAAATISILSLGKYGVPIAMAGLTYMLLFSTCLLPGGGSSSSTTITSNNATNSSNVPNEEEEDDDEQPVLLGARLTKWSSAAGRTVKRSGLRDTGGIYLVSVRRAATGDIHRAVGQEFVLNVGDILYFAPGIVGEFPRFCDEHGLEIVTAATSVAEDSSNHSSRRQSTNSVTNNKVSVGSTKESLEMADSTLRMRLIYKMIGKTKSRKKNTLYIYMNILSSMLAHICTLPNLDGFHYFIPFPPM